MGPGPRGGEQVLSSSSRSTRPGRRRTLTECLRIQLRVLGLENSPADVMCATTSSSSRAPVPGIRGRWVDRDEVAHHSRSSRALPAPGNRYSARRSDYILPDVFVVKEGRSTRSSSTTTGSQLRISPTTGACSTEGAGLGGDRAYVKDKLRSACGCSRASTSGSAPSTRCGVDRAPPACLPGPRCFAPAAAGAADWRATSACTSHGVTRGGQQVHAHAARRLRAALLLPQRDHLDHGEAISSVTSRAASRR